MSPCTPRWSAPAACFEPATFELEAGATRGASSLTLALVRTPSRAVASAQAPPTEAVAALHEGERARLLALAGVRAHDFAAGRLGARAALVACGGPEHVEVASDAHGRPVAPPGFSLSVSHAPGLAAALVRRDDATRGPPRARTKVGVDVERVDRPRDTIARRVLTPRELDAWSASPARALHLARAFAVKEAIYKAVHPFVERYVRFHEVELEPSLARGPMGDELLAVPLVPRFEPALTTSDGAMVRVEASVALADDGWLLAIALAVA